MLYNGTIQQSIPSVESSRLVTHIRIAHARGFSIGAEYTMSRREQIESMLADSPADIFLRYALAMELDGEGENDRSLEIFQGLIAENPPYVPAFFMTGQQLARLDRINEARAVLRAGIDQARTQNDLHAASEMSEFLGSLGELGE